MSLLTGYFVLEFPCYLQGLCFFCAAGACTSGLYTIYFMKTSDSTQRAWITQTWVLFLLANVAMSTHLTLGNRNNGGVCDENPDPWEDGLVDPRRCAAFASQTVLLFFAAVVAQYSAILSFRRY
jgi:hypothetical protein